MDSVRKSLLAVTLLAGALLCLALPRLQAEDLDRCQRRVVHAEHELHEAIEKHGRNSRQANHERRELRAAREHCWRERQVWWGEHGTRWPQERGWLQPDHTSASLT